MAAPDIRAAVVAALKADAGVSGVVGDRVFPLVVPQTAITEAVSITVQVVSMPRNTARDLDSRNLTTPARVQVVAVGWRLIDCAAAASAARAALDGFRGMLDADTRVVETVLAAEYDAADDLAVGKGQPLYRTVTEFVFRFKEDRPTNVP